MLGDKSKTDYREEPELELGPQWKQYHCTLLADKTATNGSLFLWSTSVGTIWLDQVSLFSKETWKNRPNGLRPILPRCLPI